MKENIEDISADIKLQYGERNMDRNIAYVLSLVKARIREDGRLDDNIRRSRQRQKQSFC